MLLKDNLPLCGREKGAEALQRKTSNDTMDEATNRRQRSKEDSKMSELSLTQGKYPWGFLKIGRQTANSFNRPPPGGLFLYIRENEGIKI